MRAQEGMYTGVGWRVGQMHAPLERSSFEGIAFPGERIAAGWVWCAHEHGGRAGALLHIDLQRELGGWH